MTSRSLFRVVLAVALFVLIYAGIVLWAYCYHYSWYTPIKDAIPLVVAFAAAFLAAAFQRRLSYLQALRDLWKQLIPAIEAAIQYTHLGNQTQSAFARVMEGLSTAIDLTRGVFSNVPASGTHSGLFPFENLKDIMSIISWLGFDNSRSASDRQNARRCITNLWQEMHLAMLPEFDRDVPVEPVSKYLYDGCSIGDLLQKGSLTAEDLKNPRRASHPRTS